MAFVNASEVRQYNFSDIGQWQWVWKDVNGNKRENKLVVDVKDVANPVFHIHFNRADDAEQWNSRLSLVIQGT